MKSFDSFSKKPAGTKKAADSMHKYNRRNQKSFLTTEEIINLLSNGGTAQLLKDMGVSESKLKEAKAAIKG